MTRIGVVTEGKTDLPLLKVVLDEGLPDHAPFELRCIVPEPDATGSLNRGGWRYVKAWCLRNAPTTREALYLRPIFDAEGPCRSLLFMVDADIAADLASLDNVPVPTTPAAQAALVRAHLRAWLESVGTREAPWVAVQAPETWAACALKPELVRPESIPALEALKLAGEAQQSAKKLDKSVTRAEVWARRMAGRVQAVVEACPHLANDLSLLDTALRSS